MAKNKKIASSNDANIRHLGQKLIKRHHNLVVYMIFGFLAALINTVVFMVLHKWWHSAVVISNTIAFIISNLASFFFNQKAVFINNVDHEHSNWHKLLVFFLPDYQLNSWYFDNGGWSLMDAFKRALC